MTKIFIIGLPRTGTTSVCSALLNLGYKVAHTAYSKHTFELAEVIADTPAFCDYRQLDSLFPQSRFIYLHRPLALWLPSIKILLQKIYRKGQKNPQAFHPVMLRCYRECFGEPGHEQQRCDEFLQQCFVQHQQAIHAHFKGRTDWLSLDLAQPDSYAQLLLFLQCQGDRAGEFLHLNSDGQISAWNKIRHPLKISSNAVGPDRRRFLQY